jgi:hypothetical protein
MLSNQLKQITEKLKLLHSKKVKSKEDEMEIEKLEKWLDNLFDNDWE